MILRFLTSLLLLTLGTASVAPVRAGMVLDAPTYLDAGPSSAARPETVSLGAETRHTPERGYGWVTPPTGSFSVPQFSGVRAAPLTDGVTGADYTLRLALAPRRWTVIAFLDDGFRDAHTVAIEVNGRTVAHNPRVFGLESEPEAGPINRYRVAQFQLPQGGDVGLRFRQVDGHARLLALRLLPMDWPETDMTRWLSRQISDVGRHPFGTAHEILRMELAQHEQTPALAAFAAYWRAQLDLLAEAEEWHRRAGWDAVSAATRSSMFVRYKIALACLDPLVEHPDGDAFVLRDRARWLRARLLYWIWVEQHLPPDEVALREDLAVLRRQHPDDPLIAMYAGERVPLPDDNRILRPLAGAPAWSAAQFEALQRLRDVAHYWINERQAPNGEFGGKTDDDVELLRWWPVLMFSGDTAVRDGFRRMAEGMWFSPRLHEGYSRVARDVEHSAEFVSDTVPMMALITRDPEWIARLGWSHRHMRDLWTARNAQGHVHFKSAWLGATEILSEPPRNRDLSMNARAVKAVRYHAWLTQDADAVKLLHEWSLAWSVAAARTDKGKPRGLFPASVRWPDAAFNGDEPSWHRANMFWPYFDWRGDGRLYDQLFFSWWQTRDDRLLEPLRDTLALLQREDVADNASTPPEGSAAWAAAQLRQNPEFWNVVAQWRLETGDARFDTFLAKRGPAYLRFRLGGDPALLAEAIEATLLDVLRYNRPLRTSEVLFTDRVFVSRDQGPTDGADLLAAMLTGSHTAQGESPYYHVAWEQAPTTLTALVTAASADTVSADVYLHQREKASVTARFFRQPAGTYRLRIETPDQGVVTREEQVRGPDHRVTVEVPGGTIAKISLTRVAP